MRPEPSQRSAHCKAVQAAAEELRRGLLGAGTSPSRDQIGRLIAHGLLRRLSARHTLGLEPDTDDLAGVRELPIDLLGLLQHPSWEPEIEQFTVQCSQAGKSVMLLTRAKGDMWRHAAAFLNAPGIADLQVLQMPDTATADEHPAHQLLYQLQRNDSLAAQVVQAVFQLNVQLDLPDSPSECLVRQHILDVTRGIDWDEECAELRQQVLDVLKNLRLSCDKSTQLKRVRGPAWYAAAAFLLVWYRRERRAVGVDSPQSLQWFLDRWLSNPGDGAVEPDPVPPSTMPFNPAFSMPADYRVYTPGSGQTRAPGSRRNNRGHD